MGFDLLIDKKLKCWLLEINDHPSMSVYACKNDKGCDHEVEGCGFSIVDIYTKTAVQQDTIEMLSNGIEEERYKSL